ncbi:MAG: hypothetical protein MI747_09765 [Desulfobacterales bacterium]|nr:hypothetical protein [Desulfobacterales bacterium]
MAESVKVLPDKYQAMIQVSHWDLRTLEGVNRFREIQATCLPSIALDGQVVYASRIPAQEELCLEIEKRYHGQK